MEFPRQSFSPAMNQGPDVHQSKNGWPPEIKSTYHGPNRLSATLLRHAFQLLIQILLGQMKSMHDPMKHGCQNHRGGTQKHHTAE